jgi:hypothetical protein
LCASGETGTSTQMFLLKTTKEPVWGIYCIDLHNFSFLSHRPCAADFRFRSQHLRTSRILESLNIPQGCDLTLNILEKNSLIGIFWLAVIS